MIEAKELRKGNMVYTGHQHIIKINSIFEDFVNYDIQFNNGYNYSFLHGIPLNEEWLLKFGAKIVLVKEIKYYVINGLSFLHNGVDGYYMGLGKGFSVYVGYVHKLQNLYYEIRGKELTLSGR